MKKRFGITLAAFAASGIIVLSGCAGCAGCNAPTKNVAALDSNWYANTSYKNIQPTFTEGNALFQREKITYKVKFDSAAAGNPYYSVSYADGTYTTEFYAAEFDKETLAAPEFKGSYPDGLVAYCYKTELDIPSVTFKRGSEEKTFEGDKKVTECWFLSVKDSLQPLYSKITDKSVTPANAKVNDLSQAYTELNYTYVTYYDYEGRTAKTITADVTGKQETKTTDIGGVTNTLFDVASLDIAVRACKLKTDLSQTVALYSPNSGANTYGFAGSSSPLGDSENEVKALLSGKGLYEIKKDENGNELPLRTVAVSVLFRGTLSGVSQTYWFTAIENPANNKGRATMLRYLSPLPYSLGALDYTLESIDSTLYN